MLKKISLFLIAVSLLLFAHQQANHESHLYLLWIPFVFTIALYFHSEKDQIPFYFLCALMVLSLLIAGDDLGAQFTLAVSLVFAVSMVLWFFLIGEWDNAVLRAEHHRQRIKSDIQSLKGKYESRIESLSHLEKQVHGLQSLFEVARDFNECLAFDDLLKVIDKKVRAEIPFQTMHIFLKEIQKNKESSGVRCYALDANGITNSGLEPLSVFEQSLLKIVEEEKAVMRFEQFADLEKLGVEKDVLTLPLWAFHLRHDEKTRAGMVVSGGSVDDFPKFELLASQLALQVKKIWLYETVKQLSIVDGLTKTYVRRHFLERFEEEFKRALKRRNPLTVLILDIDHFKSYNDTFGHLVGDSTLREVASVIRQNVRKVDLVSRYGGEEFAIVMPDIDRPANLESAERIRSAVARKSFKVYDEETKVTVSIGFATFPKDSDNPLTETFTESAMLELLQKADKALYRAKEEGRNRVVSYDQIK